MPDKSLFNGLLLVSDLDGTLITDTFEMPSRNSEAARAFMAGGGLFAFATGRTRDSAGAFRDRVPVNAPCILLNGSAIYDYGSGRLLWGTFLPETAEDLMTAVMARFPDFCAEVLTDDVNYIVYDRDGQADEAIRRAPKRFVRKELSEVPRGVWRKVFFAGPEARMDELQTFADSLPNGGWDFVCSSPRFLEALPRGVSKGNAVLRLSAMLGIDRTHICAIGDYFNDLELLKTAAFSGAPANAPPAIQKAADVTVGPAFSGAVADFIGILREKRERSEG